MREALLDEDNVQLPAWALKTSGATIDRQRTSSSYAWGGSWLCTTLGFLCAPNPPDNILQPDRTPADSWAFRGSKGQVVIRLPARICPSALTLQHLFQPAAAVCSISSFPRNIAVSGLNEEGKDTPLGTFTYEIGKKEIQIFSLKSERCKAFKYIKINILSNWGNSKYTCLYRVQVHGKRAVQD
ncbi:sperm-associated antigen 4 protein-like isoform X2 [Nothoprocta perdicaria]|nr:sperm-associated antigen 4 protein-like isoform X2 [Nothoprocta perdicaria]